MAELVIPEEILRFLEDSDAVCLPHSGRTLLQHLKGTYLLLNAWGNPEYVCLAGLFHSIYGTEVYRLQTISTEFSEKVESLIGSEAHSLVQYFSVMDRQHFVRNIGNSCLRDRRSGSTIVLALSEERGLAELLVANRLEQLSSKGNFSERIGHLGQFVSKVSPFLSQSARSFFESMFSDATLA